MSVSLLAIKLSGADLSAVVNNLVDAAADQPLSLLLLLSLYLVRPVVLLPASALTLATGLLFGPVWGVLYATFGSTLAALVAYGFTHRLGAGWTAPARLEPYRKRLATRGFATVLTMRLSFLPHDPVSYLAGWMGVRPLPFVVATLLGTLPVTAVIVGLGAAVPVGGG